MTVLVGSIYRLLAMPIPDLLVLVVSTIVPFVLKLVGAVALWIAGGWLIQLAMRIVRKSLRSSSLDATVVGYLINILAAVLRVILVVAILGFFGIQTASFAALLAAPSARKVDASPSRPLFPPGGLMEQSNTSLQRGRQS